MKNERNCSTKQKFVRIGDEAIDFVHADETHQPMQEQSIRIDHLGRRQPQDGLEIKRIQLDLKKLIFLKLVSIFLIISLPFQYHGQDEESRDPSTESLGDAPLKDLPAVRRELRHRTDQLATARTIL